MWPPERPWDHLHLLGTHLEHGRIAGGRDLGAVLQRGQELARPVCRRGSRMGRLRGRHKDLIKKCRGGAQKDA